MKIMSYNGRGLQKATTVMALAKIYKSATIPTFSSSWRNIFISGHQSIYVVVCRSIIRRLLAVMVEKLG
jgi:hypothetical protein